MYQRNAVLYLSTSGASLTALTGRGYLMGLYALNSGAAGSLIVADSANQMLIWSGAAAANLAFTPLFPIACTGGLSVTGSGAVTYMIMFASQ